MNYTELPLSACIEIRQQFLRSVNIEKDYQTDAVRDVLSNLEKARMDWHGSKPYKSAFSLTAVTGAGRLSVMA